MYNGNKRIWYLKVKSIRKVDKSNSNKQILFKFKIKSISKLNFTIKYEQE